MDSDSSNDEQTKHTDKLFKGFAKDAAKKIKAMKQSKPLKKQKDHGKSSKKHK